MDAKNQRKASDLSFMGAVGAAWGVAGVFALIGWAVFRLSQVAAGAFAHTLGARHWVFLVTFLLFMLVSEGYRGFQKNFAPRVAARARHLRDHPRAGHVLLAPLFCMSYFHATPRRLLGAYGLTAMIVVLVVGVRRLPQPWHGLVDVGVAAGLMWGLVALVVFTYRAFGTEGFSVSPEVPRPSSD
jgi:hypothetical protein